MYVKRNNKARSCNHCCSGRTISIAYYECVFVALVIQYAMRMRHMVICSLFGTKYFSTVSYKQHGFPGGGIIEHKICDLMFSPSCRLKDFPFYEKKFSET